MKFDVIKLEQKSKSTPSIVTHYIELTWQDWIMVSALMSAAYGEGGTIPWSFQFRFSRPKWYYGSRGPHGMDVNGSNVYFTSEEQITYLTLMTLDL